MMYKEIFDLSGKVAVMTGASANGGLAHVMSLAFAEYGADVVVSDIDEAGSQVTAQEVRDLGRRSIALHCNVSKPQDVESLFKEVDRQFGRVDILVNAPFAIPSRVRPHELTLENWNKTFAICLTGFFLCSQQAIRRMLSQGGGCILNIGSIAGVSALGRGNFPYSCAKAGVHQMTKELALEYAQDNIRVNCVVPSQTMTPGLKNQLEADPTLAERIMPLFLAGIPIGRLLEADEFAGAALFLCSDAGKAVTGALLPVDGGNLAMNAGGSKVWPKD
jgi:NAD(P)-dependent dehydrogenase (short-subunit alcohol dehydrogenase family)